MIFLSFYVTLYQNYNSVVLWIKMLEFDIVLPSGKYKAEMSTFQH